MDDRGPGGHDGFVTLPEGSGQGGWEQAAATTATDEEPTCAACGGRIRQDDIVCPHCGTPLVAG
jgi:hypothetical protein